MRIERRTRRDGTESWRAIVRRAGHPCTSSTFVKRRDAEEWGIAEEGRILRARAGLYAPPTNRTLGELIVDYLERHEVSGSVRGNLEWWQERLGKDLAVKVRGSRIRRALDTLDASGATKNRYLSSLSGVFRDAIERDDLERNPCRDVRRASEKGHVIRWLTDQERRDLLHVCSRLSPALYARALRTKVKRPKILEALIVESARRARHLHRLVLVSLWTGGRRSEVMALRWRDIDVRRQLVEYPATKGGCPRLVPAPPEVFASLGTPGHPDQGVFPGGWPRPAWKVLLNLAKIENFRWHDLRHSFCSWLVQRGVPLADVQQMAGHKSIQTTLRYAHLAPTDAHERIRAVLNEHRSPPARVLQMPEPE